MKNKKINLPHLDSCIFAAQVFPALAAGTVFAVSLLAKDQVKYYIKKRIKNKKGE